MEREIEVEGILVGLDWRNDGEVLALGLNLPDERELRLECSDEHRERLVRHLRQRVALRGVMDEHAQRFHPRHCRVLGPPGPGRGTGGRSQP